MRRRHHLRGDPARLERPCRRPRRGRVPDACDGDWGVAAFAANSGLHAEDATCACGCDAEPTPPVVCPTSASLLTFADNLTTCDQQVVQSVETLVPGCNDIAYYDDASFTLEVPAVDLSGASCGGSLTQTLSEVTFDEEWLGCAPVQALDTCGTDGACVPALGADEPLCVWKDGDEGCPAGFPARSLLSTGVDDQRGCTACSCSPAASCDATVTLRAGESCVVASPGAGSDGECFGIETPARSAELAFDAPVASCEAQPVSPTGEAVAIDLVTVCCAE
ncbi:MAG: hypothetical protein R3F59_26355 [Myxococcota bacterium]